MKNVSREERTIKYKYNFFVFCIKLPESYISYQTIGISDLVFLLTCLLFWLAYLFIGMAFLVSLGFDLVFTCYIVDMCILNDVSGNFITKV